MERPPLGEQELEVLRFITDHAPISARAVSEHFAGERGLARTTILTVMERLRKKGYLTRKRREAVFFYSPGVPKAELLQGLVRDFVEKTLGGSVSPVVAYLAHSRRLTDEEWAELQKIVDEMRTAGREERS